jgi:hypothetical protein
MGPCSAVNVEDLAIEMGFIPLAEQLRDPGPKRTVLREGVE